LASLIILEQSLKNKSGGTVLKMIPNSVFFNIFRKYTIMEKRIEEFVKIAVASLTEVTTLTTKDDNV
jgi:hypothetical protein